ncbi:unnamed protein product [Linum trigynum]|uniref:Uncharacterized protein n=1 Tax=Linum trigynum TaxID=586398 RepID=A0AAV2D334_9ROSI
MTVVVMMDQQEEWVPVGGIADVQDGMWEKLGGYRGGGKDQKAQEKSTRGMQFQFNFRQSWNGHDSLNGEKHMLTMEQQQTQGPIHRQWQAIFRLKYID